MAKKNRRKKKINWKWHLLDAAKSYVRSEPFSHSLTDSQVQKRALSIVKSLQTEVGYPTLRRDSPINSEMHQNWLRRMKWWANANNVKANTLKNLISKNGKESFALVKEMQRELLGFLSEVAEEEQKILGGYSKVHSNSFVRSMDKPLQWKSQLMIKDYKTGFPYKEKFLMEVINNSGLGLPRKGSEKLPVRDIYIVDELTDRGDTMHQIVDTDPMDLSRANKNFHYVILRKENDHTSRKFRSKTSFDTYPYNCVSTLTIEMEFPSIVQVNYFNFVPIGDSTVHIPPDGISYRSEDGSDISLNAITVPGETSSTLIFQPVWTRFLRISFQQYGTVGRTELSLGDKRKEVLNNMFEGIGFVSRLPNTVEKVKGRIYDFSLAEVSAGFYAFEPKGIFRSGTPIQIDSPIGFDLRWQAEQLAPIESFDTYMKTATFPEGKVLLESYLDVRLYGGSKVPAISAGDSKRKQSDVLTDTLVVDSLVPVPDSYPLQMEFLAPIVRDARVKLFPNFKWNRENFVLNKISLVKDRTYVSNTMEALLSAICEGMSASERNDVYSNLSHASNILTNTKYSTGTIPKLLRFDISNSDHVAAHSTVADAIEDMASARRPSMDRNVSIVFKAPPQEDLQYLMGTYYADADLALKYDIETNPQNYLLLWDDIVWGTNRKLKNLTNLVDNRSGTIYARTCRSPTGDQESFLLDCISGTKIIGLDIVNIESSTEIDTVTVQIRVIKSPDDLGVMQHLPIKQREQVRRIADIHNKAKAFQKYLLDVTKGVYDNGDITDESASVMFMKGSMDSNGKKIKKLLTALSFAINRGQWVLFPIPADSDGGIFAKKELSAECWVQFPGRTGTSLFGAAYNAYKNNSEAFSKLSAAELSSSYVIPENHELFGLKISAIKKYVGKYYKYKPIIFSDTGNTKYDPITDQYNIFGPFWQQDEDADMSDWILSQYGLPTFVEDDNFDPLDDGTAYKYQIRNELLIQCAKWHIEQPVWRFRTEGSHRFGIGDTISLSSVPSDFLGGEYNIVNCSSSYLDLKVYSNKWSAVPEFCIKNLSPSTAKNEFKNYSDLTDYNDLDQAPYTGKPNPFIRQSDGQYAFLIDAMNDVEIHSSYIEYLKNIAAVFLGAGKKTDKTIELATGMVTYLYSYYRDSPTGKENWMPGIDDEDLRERDVYTLFEKMVDYDKLIQQYKNGKPYDQYLLGSKLDHIISYFNNRIIDDWKSDTLVNEFVQLHQLAVNEEYSGGYKSFPITKALNSGWQAPPFDVYENDTKLLIGEDYLISLNEKSDWLAFWPTDSSLDKYWDSAAAGNCYIRLKQRDNSSFYWVKYRVNKKQRLSEEGKITLENGRVTCHPDLRGSSGTVDVVLLARANSFNPYITPIVSNYSLRIQEQPNVQRNSGKLNKKKLGLTSRRGTNVS